MKTWQDWEETHQPFELQYHIEKGIPWCEDDLKFREFWGDIFDFIGVKRPCIDIGCGPRPPFGAFSTAIDPLADQYRRLRPKWWEGVRSYSTPAERFHTELSGRFQTVMCWNCLDHTIGWQQILQNLSAYGRQGATFALATDFNPPSVGHPGFDEAEFFTELAKHFEIQKYERNFQERDIALVLKT